MTRFEDSSFSELDTPETCCRHCRGRGFTYLCPDNPRAVSPCGCDEPDGEDDDEGC